MLQVLTLVEHGMFPWKPVALVTQGTAALMAWHRLRQYLQQVQHVQTETQLSG
jgi:hypothetical protein